MGVEIQFVLVEVHNINGLLMPEKKYASTVCVFDMGKLGINTRFPVGKKTKLYWFLPGSDKPVENDIYDNECEQFSIEETENWLKGLKDKLLSLNALISKKSMLAAIKKIKASNESEYAFITYYH